MSGTPQRRSTRATKEPERLAPSTTTPLTPRKRGKAAGSSAKKVSAFASPVISSRGSSSKRQRVVAGKSKRNQEEEEEEEDEEEEEEEEEDEEEEEVEEVEDDESASDDDEDELSEFEGSRPAAPASAAAKKTHKPAIARKAKPKAKQQTMKSKKNASVQDEPSTTSFQSQLLDAILDERTALAQVVNDWIGRYRSTGGDAATSELLNFLIKLTGTTTSAPPVTAATLYDDVAETLDDLQAQSIAALQRNEGEDDLLMGKTKEHRRIRKSVLQFLVKLVSDGQHHLLFDEVNEESRLSPFIEALLQWLVSMAGSSYRPFRHVATLAALCVQTAVVGIRARISVELQTTHRQLETEAKRGSSSSRRGGGGSGKQQQQLRDRVAQLSQQDEVAEAAFKAFYDTVFIYRYRDVQATIRSECIVPLATWCRAFPAAYLDTEYLRYLGWALNDKDARVRETALAAIGGPLLLGKQPVHGGVGSGVGGCGGIAGTAAAAAASSEDSVAEGIRPFIGRFLPRIVQVAAGDIDVKVQVAALKLVALLGKHQYLDPTAKIGDIRSIKKSGQKAQKKKKKPKKKTLLSRGSYSNSLSQQLLEESSSEEEEEEEDEEEAATAAGGGGVIEIQTLYELNAEDEEEEEAGQLRCPRHTTMRFLAPLVTHAQAAVRGAAAELVAWWVREDWARAARVAALGLGHAHDEHEDEDEGEGGDESEDEDDDASAEDLLRTAGGRRRVQRWAVFKAVAAFLARLARGDQQAEAEADGDFGGADDDDDDDSGGPARLLAAAAALWGRVAELGSLAALAAFLGRDHSQQRRRAFALAAREETTLLQAFAAWVQEPGDHPRAARKAAPGGRSSAAAAAAAAAGSKGWQAALPRLLARNGDSAARTAALAGAAAAALDVQALFDADRGACVEAVAQHLSAALQRHAACARVVRPAAAFLARVDGSAVLRERWCLLAAVQAAGATRVVALRALLRVADVASAVRVGDLLALAQEAATAEGVALAALDAALHAVLWRAAGALTGAEGLRTDPDVEGLRADAAALLASCEALADAAHGGRPRLAELAFVALGRVLRVLTGGPLARAHAALAAVVDAAAAARIRQRLDAFFEQRMATLRFDAPAEYARACALAAAWAAWLGDQTLPPAHFPRLAAQTGAWRGTTAPAARRRVGFVALSAVDHIVQAAADALRPQLARERTRPAAVDALAASLRAAFEAPAQPPADAAVNAATLARFVAAALRTAEAPAAALAPAPVGAAWAAAHVSAIAYGLALAAAAADDSDAAWDARVAPWFVVLSQTVAGVLRPRHAHALSQRLADATASAPAAAAAAALAAVAPYQRALDKERAKLGAVEARLAETRAAAAAQAATSPPRLALLPADKDSAMDIDE